MRASLHFRMGTHSLPVVLGRRTGIPRASACASAGAIWMLFMMSGISCLNALPCSVCGIGTLPVVQSC